MMQTKKDEYYLASCFGKEGHTATVARAILRRYSNATAYKCSRCRAWHIGSRQSQGKTIKTAK